MFLFFYITIDLKSHIIDKNCINRLPSTAALMLICHTSNVVEINKTRIIVKTIKQE